LKARFETKGLAVAADAEKCIVNACRGKISTVEVEQISEYFGSDIDKTRLQLHLQMLGDICCSRKQEVSCFSDAVGFLRDNKELINLLPEFVHFLELILVLPVTT
jgi:hypothetical protein